MRPRILYELSRRLAILLEESLRGGAVGRIPVFLCHPLDPLESRDDLESNAAGILYPVRVTPDTRLRRSGVEWEPGTLRQPQEACRWQSLWVRVRYVFLVAGGSLELELEALAAALRALHDHSAITLDADIVDGDTEARATGNVPEGQPRSEELAFPLAIIDAPESWRELGLPDHRRVVTFEVTVPIRSARVETVARVLERELKVGGGGP